MSRLVVALLGWLLRRLGLRSTLMVVLLLVALMGVGTGLADIVHELDSRLMAGVAAIGLLVGWGLALTVLPTWAVWSLIPVLGLGFAILRVGQLGGALTSLAYEMVVLAWGFLKWLVGGGLPPSALPSSLAWGGLRESVEALFSRTCDWVAGLASGSPVFDPAAAALVWSFLLWLASAWAGWVMRRRNWAIASLLPAGVLLAATLGYARGDTLPLLILLGAMLLLLAVSGYDSWVRRWVLAGVDFADLGGEAVATVLGISAALVVLAAVAPSLSLENIVESIREARAGQTGGGNGLATSLGVEPPPGAPTTFGRLRSTGLPQLFLLTGGPELDRQVMMVIRTGDLPPAAAGVVVDHPPPNYRWRSHTYDRYSGRGWSTSDMTAVEYAPGEQILTSTLAFYRSVRQEVLVVGDTGGLIYTAGMPVAVDRASRVAWRSHDDLFGVIVTSTVYHVVSLWPEISEDALRSAGSDYPSWIRERYLELPDAVPSRVLALARDLTASAPTPYDRALAIQNYLRTFSYTLDISLPPPGREATDYFLFDLRRGYCGYYATAMVVLARAAGLPARVVIGYTSGSYDPYLAQYVVTQANAHAWAEVYFPGYGWVEFEPTAGFAPVDRAGVQSTPPMQPGGGVSRATTRNWRWMKRLWEWTGGAVGVLASAVVIWAAASVWRLYRLRPVAAVAELYRRLRHQCRRLAVPVREGDTPYEFAASLAGWAETRAQSRAKNLVPGACRLIDLYVQGLYTPRGLGAAERAEAIRIWGHLWWRLWAARVRARN